MTELKKGTNRW